MSFIREWPGVAGWRWVPVWVGAGCAVSGAHLAAQRGQAALTHVAGTGHKRPWRALGGLSNAARCRGLIGVPSGPSGAWQFGGPKSGLGIMMPHTGVRSHPPRCRNVIERVGALNRNSRVGGPTDKPI